MSQTAPGVAINVETGGRPADRAPRAGARRMGAFGAAGWRGRERDREDGAVTKCRVCATGCDYVFGGATQGGRLFVLSFICNGDCSLGGGYIQPRTREPSTDRRARAAGCGPRPHPFGGRRMPCSVVAVIANEQLSAGSLSARDSTAAVR